MVSRRRWKWTSDQHFILGWWSFMRDRERGVAFYIFQEFFAIFGFGILENFVGYIFLDLSYISYFIPSAMNPCELNPILNFTIFNSLRQLVDLHFLGINIFGDTHLPTDGRAAFEREHFTSISYYFLTFFKLSFHFLGGRRDERTREKPTRV